MHIVITIPQMLLYMKILACKRLKFLFLFFSIENEVYEIKLGS